MNGQAKPAPDLPLPVWLRVGKRPKTVDWDIPCTSDCRQAAREGIPTGSSSHSTEKWSYLRPEEVYSAP